VNKQVTITTPTTLAHAQAELDSANSIVPTLLPRRAAPYPSDRPTVPMCEAARLAAIRAGMPRR
jgi:hypothetical protein